MSDRDGGPAFPQGEKYTTTSVMGDVHHNSKAALHSGMSLRQWYAGLAMQGMLANPECSRIGGDAIAEAAFEQADFMIAAEQEQSS